MRGAMSLWFYCTLLLWAGIGTSKGDSIVVSPGSLIVASGGETTLSCFVSAGTVEWLRGPQLGNLTVVENNTREVLSADGSQITVIVSEEASGDYYCLNTVPFLGSTLSCPSSVSLAVITSSFEVDPSDTGAKLGEDAVIPCRPPASQPPAVVGWTRDGHALVPDDSHVVGPCGLVITNVSMADVGVYQCVAMNPVTMEKRYSKEAHFNVTAAMHGGSGLGTPSIMVAPLNTTVAVGGNVTLQCVVTGCPVTWSRPQGGLSLSTSDGVLLLENVSPSDGGQYVCTSLCRTSVLSATASVLVQEAPIVTLQPFAMVSEGDDLSCVVSGKGLTWIYWLQAGVVLAAEEQFLESSVTFSYSFKGPSGLYQCMAISSQECGHAEVYVMATPTIATTPPPLTTPTTSAMPTSATPTSPLPTLATPTATPLRISLKPSGSVVIGVGESVELVCTAAGIEVPILAWNNASNLYQPVTTVNSSSDSLAKSAWASIVVGTSGMYSCLAIAGSAALSMDITVTVQVPSMSAAVHSLDGEEGDVLNLTCTISACSFVSTDVVWSKAPLPLPLPSILQGNTTSLSLGPLAAMDAGNYICSVKCSNGIRATDQMVVKVTTLRPPPLPPGNVTALRTNDITKVTWVAPPLPPYLSPILGYKLNWNHGTGPLPQSGITSVSAVARSISIATSDPLSSYTVAVWAYSRGGDGPMRVVTVQPLITNPFSIISCTPTSGDSADIQWESYVAVTMDTRLVYSCNSAQVVQSVGVAVPGVAHLTQLLPNCSYDVWLQVNGKDEGNCTLTTHPGPLNITATAVNGAVQLHWLLPQGAKVQLYIADHWVDITLGGVVAPLWGLRSVVVMVTVANWTATSVITLPVDGSTTSNSSTSPSPSPVNIAPGADTSKQLGLLYGIILGSLVAACIIVLSSILALKYVQMSRMNQNKETGTKDQRKKQTEAFRRMSVSRSSSGSLGKTPPPPCINTVHRSPATHPSTCIGYLGGTIGSITMDTSSRHSTITSSSLKMTPPPGMTPPPASDHSSGMSDDAGSVGAVTYTIVTTRKPRKDVIVTDI